jgi:hypothetical protein
VRKNSSPAGAAEGVVGGGGESASHDSTGARFFAHAAEIVALPSKRPRGALCDLPHTLMLMSASVVISL